MGREGGREGGGGCGMHREEIWDGAAEKREAHSIENWREGGGEGMAEAKEEKRRPGRQCGDETCKAKKGAMEDGNGEDTGSAEREGRRGIRDKDTEGHKVGRENQPRKKIGRVGRAKRGGGGGVRDSTSSEHDGIEP